MIYMGGEVGSMIRGIGLRTTANGDKFIITEKGNDLPVDEARKLHNEKKLKLVKTSPAILAKMTRALKDIEPSPVLWNWKHSD
tara:strand:+ start:313 stop:561 length:249 start_codon:yes stop_codon:yes gene_type:complete